MRSQNSKIDRIHTNFTLSIVKIPQQFMITLSKNPASIYDNMYWNNQLATQKEGDICGGCFSPDTNFDCGKCVEGLECVKDPGSALLQDLPSKCRKPSVIINTFNILKSSDFMKRKYIINQIYN